MLRCALVCCRSLPRRSKYEQERAGRQPSAGSKKLGHAPTGSVAALRLGADRTGRPRGATERASSLALEPLVGAKTTAAEKKETPPLSRRGLKINSGGVLLSHAVSRAVPSALEGLTSEFEMGSGMTPPTSPPENSYGVRELTRMPPLQVFFARL